jgi:hypothetical protein
MELLIQFFDVWSKKTGVAEEARHGLDRLRKGVLRADGISGDESVDVESTKVCEDFKLFGGVTEPVNGKGGVHGRGGTCARGRHDVCRSI